MWIPPVILPNVNHIYEKLAIKPEPLVSPQIITTCHAGVSYINQYFPLTTWLSVGNHPLMLDMIQDVIDYQGIHGFIPI